MAIYELHFAVRVFFPTGNTLNFWTGNAPIFFNGQTFGDESIGRGTLSPPSPVEFSAFGELISVSLLPLEAGLNESRATLQLAAVESRMRQLLLQDPGPAKCEIYQIYRQETGGAWSVVPRIFRGRLSNPKINRQTYSVDVVQRIADLDRGRPLKWSDQAQKARHPGDRGFEHAAQLAAGLDIRWPP